MRNLKGRKNEDKKREIGRIHETNTNAFIFLTIGPLTLPSPHWGEG